MKRFLAIFIGTPEALERTGWTQLSDDERRAREAEGMAAWCAWATKHADAIVDVGAPLGKTKRVSAEGIEDIRNVMAAYAVMQAASHAAAAELFVDHPHFTIFPGDSVEIMECRPMPG